MDTSAVLNLVSAFALIVGLVFAIAQVRLAQRQRQREATLQLVQSFCTPEFVSGFTALQSLPDGLSKAEVEERLGEKIVLARVTISSIEAIGMLVEKREVPLALVEDFLTGPVLVTWRKSEHYIRDMRVELELDTILEYVEWLAERIKERRKTPRLPAYVAHRDWKQ